MRHFNNNNTILTITGSDGTGGSGIQSDIKTITALGCYAASAITSIMVQNSKGIHAMFDIPADIVAGEIHAVMEELKPSVVKIGMMHNMGMISTIIDFVKHYKPKHVVFDPGIVSSQGKILMSDDVIRCIEKDFFPLCSLVVLKVQAAEYLLNRTITSVDDMLSAAGQLLKRNCKSVLLGGLYTNDSITDVLVVKDAKPLFVTTPGFIDRDVHGAGGAFAAAIAAFICKGMEIQKSVEKSREYLNGLIVRSLNTDTGYNQYLLLNHGHDIVHNTVTGNQLNIYNNFLNEIAANYRDHADVSFYAHKLNISVRYLSKITKMVIGKNPKDLIDNYRMREIEIQLTTTNKDIKELAYEYNFQSQSHLTKFFRRLRDCSPTEYRKRQCLK